MKPTQRVGTAPIGIQPDVLPCGLISGGAGGKEIALFSDVDEAGSLRRRLEHLRGPAEPYGAGLDQILLRRLSLPETAARMDDWQDLVERIRNPKDQVTIHFVGKYVEYEDSYKSINEALFHGGFHNRFKVKLRYVEAEALEGPDGVSLLEDAVGILVAPGFGDRGSRGMTAAAEYARTKRIPYFGICYGFQWAVAEFARTWRVSKALTRLEVVENAEHKIIYKLRDLLRG